jgi:threonyl-tRNA synthetase
MQEVTSFLKMLHEVYGIFGLDYSMALSTRPESYLGARVGVSAARRVCRRGGPPWLASGGGCARRARAPPRAPA